LLLILAPKRADFIRLGRKLCNDPYTFL